MLRDVLFVMQHLGREGQGRQDVFAGDVRIGFDDHIESPAVGQPAQDKLDRNTRALDDGFPEQNVRITGYAVSPVHLRTLNGSRIVVHLRLLQEGIQVRRMSRRPQEKALVVAHFAIGATDSNPSPITLP